MKKKLLVLTMSMMVAAFAFCGCGKKEESTSRESRPAQTATEPEIDVEKPGDVQIDDSVIGDEPTEAIEGTLEAFYNQPANKSQLDAAMSAALQSYGDYYSDCDWYCFDNTLTYTYVYQDGVQVDAKAIEDGLKAQEDAVISAIKQESGVTDDIVVNYIYYDADGNCVADVYLGLN